MGSGQSFPAAAVDQQDGGERSSRVVWVLAIVPALALVRQYGSGKQFEPFGIPLFPGFETAKIAWMVELGNLFHCWLGWALFAMIVGHIFMVFWHRRRSAVADVFTHVAIDSPITTWQDYCALNGAIGASAARKYTKKRK